MAEKATKAPESAQKKYVPVTLPMLSDRDEDEVVLINGHKYVIRRGETVMVPQEVKEVLDHKAEMQRKAAAHRAKFREKSSGAAW